MIDNISIKCNLTVHIMQEYDNYLKIKEYIIETSRRVECVFHEHYTL